MSRRILPTAALVLFNCVAAMAQTPSSFDDLRDWHTLGLPMAAEWNTVGFVWQYHVAQVRAGHRFLPSISMPYNVAQSNNEKVVNATLKLADADWDFLRENRIPICLRTQNITSAFLLPPYRLPIATSSIPKSPLVWSLKGTTLNDESLIDVLGPPANWTKEGRLWGTSLLLKRLQVKHAAPAYIVFLENNEGPYDSLGRYLQVEADILSPEGHLARTWLPLSTLKTRSLRMHDRVVQLQKANPAASPDDFIAEFWNRRRAHYAAFYSAFEKQLSPSWKSKTYTAGYRVMDPPRNAKVVRSADQIGYAPQLAYFDAGSEPIYCTSASRGDFTSPEHLDILNLIPAWEAARARNPQAYRELSLYISNGGILAGPKSGRHEIMTPARYEGFVQWLLWSIHDPGIPVLLRHWCSAGEKPGDLLFDRDQYATLNSLHAGTLKTATGDTYLTPLIASVDRVCGNATLRNFWLRGKPVIVPGLGHPSKQVPTLFPYPRAGDPDNRWRLLECSANTPRADWKIVDGEVTETIRVWAVATQLEDSALVFAWSPCALTGTVQIAVPEFGAITVAAPHPWSYWTVKRGGKPQQVSFP